MTEPNWIHITDRKPEDEQDVFYFFEVLGVYKGKYCKSNYYEGYDDIEPCWGDTFYGKKGFLTDDVTHWMPAPIDEEWDGVFPDVPEDYVRIFDGHFDGWGHKDHVVTIRKDEYESLKETIKYLDAGHLTGKVCPDDNCPCHIYWHEECDGYLCGSCGKVYPTKEVEDGHVKYDSKYNRPCPHCNPHEESSREFYTNGFLVYNEGNESYSTEHFICDKCDSTYLGDYNG